MQNKLFFIFLFFIASSNYFYSQVTIGSHLEPIKGALLDLKEYENNTGGDTSTKGLSLPVVELKTLTPATGKLSESIGNTGGWSEDVHIGLLVYNNVTTLDACKGGASKGLYVWNGSTWKPVFQKKTEAPSTTITSTDVYPGANSYIVSTNSSVTIPLARAFSIWSDFGGNSPADGKVLSSATSVAGLTGILTTNIIWQDAGTVSSTKIEGTGNTANLVVDTGINQGNALVQVLIAGKVLWQWHIWVNNNNLQDNAIAYYANGSVDFYMDRFLGASTANTPGLYYQWGRNVPIQNTGKIELIDATAAQRDNLTNAIQSEKFIKFESTNSHDWYSSTPGHWNDRWGKVSGTDTKKSPFDPCPMGWKIPASKAWKCISEDANTQELGRSALSGYRSNGDGSIGDVGVAGYVWTANAKGDMAEALYYNILETHDKEAFNRANALSVRCVKEQ